MPNTADSSNTATASAAATSATGGTRCGTSTPSTSSLSTFKTLKAPMAVRKVLKTFEYLERILLTVDVRTLLLCQRVNKRFKATIENSPLLQQALWFQPSSSYNSSISRGQCEINPLLQTNRPSSHVTAKFKGHWAADRGCTADSTRPFEQGIWQTRHTAPLSFTAALHTAALTKDLQQSWQRMLLARTPENVWSFDLITDWGYMAGFAGDNSTRVQDLLAWVGQHAYTKQKMNYGKMIAIGEADIGAQTGLLRFAKVRHEWRKRRAQWRVAKAVIFGRKEKRMRV